MFDGEGGHIFVSPTSWLQPGACVWEGPQWYSHQPRLASIIDYANLEFLFNNILQLPNAGPDQFLEYLVAIKDGKYGPPKDNKHTICLIYEELGKQVRLEKHAKFETQIKLGGQAKESILGKDIP